MKVLFVHNQLSTFVRADLELLRSAHEVREISYKPGPHYLQEVFTGVAWCDLVFGWWASWHLLIPALLAKARSKGVIVVGGDYDVIYDPFGAQHDVQKRLWRDRLRWQLGGLLFHSIDQFVTFSKYSTEETLKLPYVHPQQVACIYLGLPDLLQIRNLKKKDLTLAVGRVSRYDNVKKGWATFVKAASLLPENEFEMIGVWKDNGIDALRQMNNTNVKYTGFLEKQALFQKMDIAKVLVQVSYREGFGLAVAEAMLHECVPVVTNRGSLPEVVGDTGLYVPYDDPASTANAIQEALSRQKELGPLARRRILDCYPLEKRRAKLLELVENIRDQKVN